MPRYNRQKKGSRWNTERAVQGAGSGAATGFSVGGPKGAVVGGFVGGITGGFTGRDTSIDRAPYDAAIAAYSKQRRQGARFAADESAAQSGAAFAARGFNTSELAGGVISANRGRFMRDAETDIGKVTADINLRIAEAQQKAEMADDEETRQGWLDLAQQLGTMAIGGEFTKGKLTEDMIDSLRSSNPSLIKQWVAGDIDDEELIGIYQRREKLLGKPGTLRRRFSNLEEGTQRGPLPKAILPTPAPSMSDVIRKSVDEGGGYEQSRRESIPTSPDGTQGEPANINIAGKPIAPLPEGATPGGMTDKTRQVLSEEDFDILKSLYGDVMNELEKGQGPRSTLDRRYIGGYPRPVGAPEKGAREARTETPVDAMPVDEPWWHSDFLSQQTNEQLLSMLEAMESELENPEQTGRFKQRARLQIELIQDEIERKMSSQGEGTAPDDSAPGGRPIREEKPAAAPVSAATPNPFATEQAESAYQQGQSRMEGTGRPRTNTIPRQSRWSTVEPPEAKRKGKPEPLQPRLDTSVGRFRKIEAETPIEATPPPPPDLDNVPVSTTPVRSQADIDYRKKRDPSMRRGKGVSTDEAPNPIISVANQYLGWTETKNIKELTALFDEQGVKYFGESVNPENTAWCVAFLNAVLSKAGYTPLDTETLVAKEYEDYGTESTGVVGDIAVWENHVGIVAKVGKDIMILGGNQKDGINIVKKSELDKKTGFIGYRKPVKPQTSTPRRTQSRFSR